MEMKLRAWDNHEKRWAKTHEIEGELFINPEADDTGVFYIHDKSASGKLHYTLVRSTGLHDKNGKEIWEGDKLRGHATGLVYTVFFEDGAFFARSGHIILTRTDFHNNEVIGSIYGEGE